MADPVQFCFVVLNFPSMTSALPFHGVAPFVLGMQRAQVEALAGKPDAISNESFLDDLNQESWLYEEAGVVLDFVEDEEWRLGSITIESSSVALNGVRLVGTPADKLPGAAVAAGIADLTPSDESDESGTCYESDTFGLMIWVANGVVVNFTLFPKYDESGEHPVWPAL
ncbi:MAG TPA: hypothetical protein VF472_07620 [Burkholderiaceae bacterium]